jgi:ATP-dependent helicase/nuclease subunit B
MNKEITYILQQGYSLLTPTMRLGRYLRNQYAAAQIASGKSVWESPDILPWHAWLYRFWDDYSARADSELLRLNAGQQQSIWLQLLQGPDYVDQLLQPLTVAKRAIQAWELSHQWQIPLFPEDDIYISQDVRAFQSWAHAYQQRCQAENWIDDASLVDLLIGQLSMQPPHSIQKIALIGFEDIHPQQQALLSALSNAGSEVKLLALENQNQRTTGVGFIDVRDEINAAANWVRQLLEKQSSETIGIVVPNLPYLRTQIQDQFDDVLLADGILTPAEPENKPYSISLGESLSSYPVIATAFSILALVEHALSIQEVAVLLRSPFIKGAAEEQTRRALLDASLREYGEQHLSINALSYIASNHLQDLQQSKVLLACLHEWQAAYSELPRTQSAHDWALGFSKLLATFNWPGERPMNSAEYQTLQAWQELLTQFISLDVVNSSLSYGAALAHLRQLAGGFSFQPETAELPVQIMGPVGAAGMGFDHLWCMGLHEEAWPATAEPNPFIPIVLQRQHQLPAASAEGRLAHTRHMTDCLLHSSPDVVLSYPQIEKERPLRPSPLIKVYLQGPNQLDIERWPAYSKLIFDSRQFEYSQDDQAPAIETGQRVSGGSALFKDQAACPFRAFARHRLYASSLRQADIGLDAMERGSLLHDVMQHFWGKINGHTALMEMTASQVEEQIDASIDTAIASYQRQRPLTFSDRFTLLEKQRLKIITQEWLELEKQRQPFDIIACEKKHNFVFADIEVHTRIDRIDKLDDGRQVIIDYKTGDVSVSAWFDERPDDPQLPLYAITSKSELAAIVFAKVRRGESMFVGVADGEGIVPAVKPFAETRYADELENWQGLLAGWHQNMERIASEFRQGRAEVDPKNINTCRYCDLHALCRIHEKTDPGSRNIVITDKVNESN